MSEPLTHPDDVDLAWPGPAERTHLEQCDRCRQRSVQVAAVQEKARLALEPLAGPVPVPPQVARRVAAALTAQGSGRVPGTLAPGPSRWLLAAAAAAVVVVGAAVVVPRVGGGGDTSVLQAEGQESADRVGSADAAQPPTDQPAPPDQLAPGVPPLPEELVARAGELDGPGQAPPGCGEALASAVDGTVVAAADPASPGLGGVLVVLTVPTRDPGRQAWWLPTCEAGPDRALGASGVP